MRKEKREKKKRRAKRNKEREEFVEKRCSGQTWRNPRERTSDFSLGYRVIQPSDSFKTGREVVLHREDNAWTPIFWKFLQTPRGRIFSYSVYF